MSQQTDKIYTQQKQPWAGKHLAVASGLVSIVVPVYNVEAYLPRCLASLMNQTYRKLEILLVDDGSTDGSGAICRQYAGMDSRIRLIAQANGGVSRARNTALDAASGDYVCFVDADDWLDSNWVEQALVQLQETGADCYIGGFVRSYDDGRPDLVSHPAMEARDLSPIECLREMYLQPIMSAGFEWCVASKLYQRSLWQEVRFNPQITMEEDGLVFWEHLKF